MSHTIQTIRVSLTPALVDRNYRARFEKVTPCLPNAAVLNQPLLISLIPYLLPGILRCPAITDAPDLRIIGAAKWLRYRPTGGNLFRDRQAFGGVHTRTA